MKEKKTLVYVNPIFYFDTDCTVLRHLTKEYRVIWFAVTHTSYVLNKYTMEDLKRYAEENAIEYKPYIMDCRMRSLKSFAFYYRLVKEVKRQNADLVFTSLPNMHWHVWASLLLNKKKLIQGVHDVEMHSNVPLRKVFTFINSIRCRIYQHYVTYSKSQQQLLKIKYGKDSVCVGMSVKDYGSPTLQQPIFSGKIKLLFFGTISQYKGLDILIDAIEQCYSDGINNLQLSIYGNGTFWDECRRHLKTPQLYDLKIRFIENEEIADIMSAHHFLVLPYRDVTNSGPMMIGVNYKLPLIAPDMGCFKDVYSDKTGFLYKQGYLSETLNKVSCIDKDIYQSMKNACDNLYQEYTEEAVANRYLDLFNHLTSNEGKET